MNDQTPNTTNPAVREAGQGPTGATREHFAGGGLENETTPVGNAGGLDTGITGDDKAGGGLTGSGSGLDDPSLIGGGTLP